MSMLNSATVSTDFSPVGRFAPSPSGEFHIGNLRTALLAWAYAKQQNGTFYIRSEDLDARCKPEYEAQQLRDLEALGITWDGEIVRQSARLALYAEYFTQLKEAKHLYACYCTRKELAALGDNIAQVASAPHHRPGFYPGICKNLTPQEQALKLERLENRGAAYRLATQVTEFTVEDQNFGSYTGEVDDFIICRGDGVYSYNFVAALDDALMGVNQIVRGADLLSSAPRQAYFTQLLGYKVPSYAHVPLVVNKDGQRLSKRDGAVTLTQLAAKGITVKDVLRIIAESVGVAECESATDFLQRVDLTAIALTPWIFSDN